jgi:oligopeptide/dipeptide ABC transporter ATP-binding protein
MTNLLTVDNLSVHFATAQGRVEANRGVSLTVIAGETLGLMGESGCGKTVLALALLRLQQPGEIVSGSVRLNGTNLLALGDREMERVRGRLLGLVPQDHGSALNPLHTVGAHLAETIAVRDNGGVWRQLYHSLRNGKKGTRDEFVAALRRVGLPQPEGHLASYPHQLSGGMRQRVLIALALLPGPQLLICDEPTTALDASSKGQILSLLAGIKASSSMLLISHDVEAVRYLCDRVAVMYAGSIVETASTRELFEMPLHPYTRALLAAKRYRRGSPLVSIPGEVPDLMHFPRGCAFHPRCASALPVCACENPTTTNWNGRSVACHLLS